MLLSKPQLVNNILNELSDNSNESITPYHVRHNLLDVLDSLPELFSDLDIRSKNAKTPNTRTSIFGQRAIERSGFPNYESEDNSAFGFSALRLNFKGHRNTAIGSQSLRTNIYGSDNVSVGHDSLAANVSGSGNVSIGNFGLISNKEGDFNISIGHGAGYYISGNDSYQFYLGSAPIDSGVLCSDVDGSNFTPLLRGDLQQNMLAINTNDFVGNAKLQVSGSISPSTNEDFDIGSSELVWKNLFASNIFLSSTRKFSNSDNVYFNFDLVPEDNSSYDIGSLSHSLNYLYTDNLLVNNTAVIENAEFIHQSHYLNKTINLAAKPAEVILDAGGSYSLYDYFLSETSNNLIPYLTKRQVDGAGLRVHVDTGDTFDLLLDTKSSDIPFWKSNISLELPSDAYIKANNLHSSESFEIKLEKSESDNILSIRDDYFYFGEKTYGDNNTLGFGNYNFASQGSSLITSFLTPAQENSVISQRFFSSAYGSDNAANEGYYVGFELEYDNKSATSSIINNSVVNYPARSCFSIKSFSPFSDQVQSSMTSVDSDGNFSTNIYRRVPVNHLVINRDSSSNIFAITDKENYIPQSTADFSIQDSCAVRVNTTGPNKISKLQLETNNRGSSEIICNNALHLRYNDVTSARLTEHNLDLFNNASGTHNFSVNIGDLVNKSSSVGLVHSDSNPVAASGYGAIFTKEKLVGDIQSSSLFFIDSSGNIFDMITTSMNSSDGLLFINNTNVAGGLNSFDNKKEHSSNNNTGLGFNSLNQISEGSFNTAYGSEAGKSLTTGSNNVAIGYQSLMNNKNSRHNICIGTDGVGLSVNSDFNFLLGLDDDHILLKGILGPNNENKKLQLPNNGLLEINNSTNSESLKINSNSIEVLDIGGSNYPDYSFKFNFSGNFSKTLLELNHEDPAMTNPTSYVEVDGPFAELSGNLKLKGGICFSDGSFMNSSDSNKIQDLESTQSDINSSLQSLVIEGSCTSTISRPESVNMPTYGSIMDLEGSLITVHNRDPNLTIKNGDYVVAIRIGSEYRPIWVSNEFNALVSF